MACKGQLKARLCQFRSPIWQINQNSNGDLAFVGSEACEITPLPLGKFASGSQGLDISSVSSVTACGSELFAGDVQTGQLIGAKDDIHRLDILVKLGGGATGDQRHQGGIGPDPCQNHLRGLRPCLSCHVA